MGSQSSEPSRTKLLLAFATIYLLWGSTYLAIRLAIDTIPPFLMAGCRFLLAGAILYAIGVRNGLPRPPRRHWRNAAIGSVLLFVVGNGGVTWAEQAVPSGVAALVIATLPAWLLLFDWGYGGRKGPKFREAAGIGLGLVGVATLSAPGGINPVGAAVLLVAAVGWAIGSLFTRYSDKPASPVRNSGMQMLTGGAIMVVVGLALGEGERINLAAVSWQSVAACFYLMLAAVVALPAYNWLLTVTSPALVGTYAFVNPVVAVLLGWAVVGEALSGRTGVAAALVILGVALLVWPKKPVAKRAEVDSAISLTPADKVVCRVVHS
ncbi:EamA family transporter [Limnoglobus roseus]|uniref:Putative inner membrane transporter YedA n=1 Tax=Limnoglobus roseus TaxID=2598579 RepID=A0A5C1AD40_9BACT|nr:EamA family transporter [Limnoglobus roseus]QEL15024.1 putative inner membrane transporter YedA [Limnoglobus roseus]